MDAGVVARRRRVGKKTSGASFVSGVGWPELASARGEFWRVGVFDLSSAACCGHDREFLYLDLFFVI